MMTQEDIQIRLYDFNVLNKKTEEEECIDSTKMVIQMFGHNSINESCSIMVTNFKPYFYVKVGNDWDQEMKIVEKEKVIRF